MLLGLNSSVANWDKEKKGEQICVFLVRFKSFTLLMLPTAKTGLSHSGVGCHFLITPITTAIISSFKNFRPGRSQVIISLKKSMNSLTNSLSGRSVDPSIGA